MVKSKDRIELVGVNGSLSLCRGEDGWTQVILCQDGNEVRLGAEVFGGIARKLSSFFAQSTAGPKWILSLAELHSSLYGEYAEGKALLKVQAADGRILAILEVDPVRQAQWLNSLHAHET